jgi:hypothetical protein
MLRRLIEDTAEVTIIGLFLMMVWTWANAIGRLAGV